MAEESGNATVSRPKFISFYLPQFYPTPYNDEWWGKGFTEWTNVAKARPRFKGHYQPHLPADLGFYDLRLAESREAQAELAKQYGVYGFCYYHYWFNGKRILERPMNDVLASGKPDFPFCICWANENWARTWDGLAEKMLLEQHYSPEDDLAHFQHLLPMLGADRYIRIEGKPLILLYRVELLPDPKRTAELWREEAHKAGLGGLFLVNVESNYVEDATPSESVGFDAAMRFQPDLQQFRFANGSRALATPVRRILKSRLVEAVRSRSRGDKVFRYADLYRNWEKAEQGAERRFECVTPMWDNSPRRVKRAYIFDGSTPALYERWLHAAVRRTQPDRDGERWLFINGWNEWGEGCHLEPCQKWGHAYLEATRRVQLEG